MRISNLQIKHFRGIKTANLFFNNHTVLIGDNNTGKSTVLEALDLVLGPDRLSRKPVVDEHDFYQGQYQKIENSEPPKIEIEATIINLNEDQRNRFSGHLEWWDKKAEKFIIEISGVDKENIVPALRVTFIGEYDEEDDDFIGNTYYSRSLFESETRQPFTKKDKQFCGFLYLRAIRTGSRALSLESGSLLDIILRIKELRPQMWEKIINPLSSFEVAADEKAGISGILKHLEASIRKFVPREWGVSPHLKISNLTREHLRKIITAFIATGEGTHSAPFYRQGAGTLNLLVLSMLSMIAEEKQNVIFAMEEPETAIPPYTQKRIIHEIQNLSAQSFFSSHSPYVIEEFTMDGTCMLSRNGNGELTRLPIELPEGIRNKRYRQEFRTKFCEGLLSRRVLIVEGATENSAFPAVNRKLSEMNPDKYSALEALGICTISADTDSQIRSLGKLYKSLGKEVYAVCDLQEAATKAEIEKHVDKLFMHSEKGFEDLVLKNTDQSVILRIVKTMTWPPHLLQKFPKPEDDAINALYAYLDWSKGTGGCAEFLLQCSEEELPEWIRNVCEQLKSLCQPLPVVEAKELIE